jgi:hypothetical protein
MRLGRTSQRRTGSRHRHRLPILPRLWQGRRVTPSVAFAPRMFLASLRHSWSAPRRQPHCLVGLYPACRPLHLMFSFRTQWMRNGSRTQTHLMNASAESETKSRETSRLALVSPERRDDNGETRPSLRIRTDQDVCGCRASLSDTCRLH